MVRSRRSAKRILFEEEEEIRENKLWEELKEQQRGGETIASEINMTCGRGRTSQEVNITPADPALRGINGRQQRSPQQIKL